MNGRTDGEGIGPYREPAAPKEGDPVRRSIDAILAEKSLVESVRLRVRLGVAGARDRWDDVHLLPDFGVRQLLLTILSPFAGSFAFSRLVPRRESLELDVIEKDRRDRAGIHGKAEK